MSGIVMYVDYQIIMYMSRNCERTTVAYCTTEEDMEKDKTKVGDSQ